MSNIAIDPPFDLARLAKWMDEQDLGSGPITEVARLTGGTQNVIVRFRRNGRVFVLRKPPHHSVTDGNRTMLREARLLAAIGDTNIPHPRLIAACSDETVLGAAFYLMEPVSGFSPSEGLPGRYAAEPEMRHAMGLALVNGAISIGSVDPFAIGLGDFGRTENFLGRQSSRWRSQYEGYRTYRDWSWDSLKGVGDIGDWLEANCPKTFVPGIMHGDYSLANVMFRADVPELAAIIDWELASLGDPLLDLGWLLATWFDPADNKLIVEVAPWDGFPTPGELIDHYAAQSRRDMSTIVWYKVLACYKLAIILEGTNARAHAGQADRAMGRFLHSKAVLLIQRAVRTLTKGSAR